MQETTENLDAQPGRGRILLAGSLTGAFLDAAPTEGQGCQIRTNLLEAIETASTGGFDLVTVAMAGAPADLRGPLSALRRCCTARIVLLARMSDEPKAIELVRPGRNGMAAADDYLICPVSFSSLQRLARPRAQPVPKPPASASPDRLALLEKLATEDDLTGAKNRRYTWEFARQIIERAGRQNGRVTLLVFDVDDLKHYNDQYGHLAGDAILKQVAVLIRRCCREHDVVGRIGGDEFAVIFWDDGRGPGATAESDRRSARTDHPSEAILIARRFVNELACAELHPLGPEGKGVLAISGALASFPRDGSTIDELFAKADAALLEAKRSGKNRIYIVGSPENGMAQIG